MITSPVVAKSSLISRSRYMVDAKIPGCRRTGRRRKSPSSSTAITGDAARANALTDTPSINPARVFREIIDVPLLKPEKFPATTTRAVDGPTQILEAMITGRHASSKQSVAPVKQPSTAVTQTPHRRTSKARLFLIICIHRLSKVSKMGLMSSAAHRNATRNRALGRKSGPPCIDEKLESNQLYGCTLETFGRKRRWPA